MSRPGAAWGSRLLWGQLLGAPALLLGSLQLAVQWTAWRLGFQPALGAPAAEILGWPVYPPWALFAWWLAFDADAPKVFATGGAVAVAGAGGAVLLALGLSLWRAREAAVATTYGSARWGTARDARRAGLLGPDGVVLGRLGRRLLRHDGPEHVLCFAPTRSGKGVGLVIPTLLCWPGSVLVHDLKGENWALTAGWRARLGRVIRFDPTDPQSPAWNPLEEVRPGEGEVRDVQNIADILVDPDGALERRSHWEKTAHALLSGAILHVLYAEPDKTLAGVAAFLSDPGRPIAATLRAMLETPHRDGRPHPVVAQAAREMLNRSENELSGVLSTALSFLSLYRDPVVAAVTRRCDWRIADLTEGAGPASLYLVAPPSDLARTRPLVRLVLNQCARRLTEDLATRAGGRRLLLMLDEFPALGRLEFFESALAFMAGYGLKGFLVAQSLNQLEKAYGPNHALLDNCHVRVAFAANDERTARRVSEALGVTTEQRAMRNYAGHRLAPWLARLAVSRQETPRPLLTPGEVLQLPSDEALVLVSGTPPLRARKLRAYADRRFRARVDCPAPAAANETVRTSWTSPWAGRIAAAPVRPAGAAYEPLPQPRIGPERDGGEGIPL